MSEDNGATAPPYILDLSVSVGVARFDASVMTLIQAYAARGQALVLPVLALTGASLDVRTEDGDDLLEGLERLRHMLDVRREPGSLFRPRRPGPAPEQREPRR